MRAHRTSARITVCASMGCWSLSPILVDAESVVRTTSTSWGTDRILPRDRDAHLQHRIEDADRRIGGGDVKRGARHGDAPQHRLRAVVRVDLEITGGEPDVFCFEIEEKVSVVTRRARAEPHPGGAFVPRCIDVAHSKAAAPAAQVQQIAPQIGSAQPADDRVEIGPSSTPSPVPSRRLRSSSETRCWVASSGSGYIETR